MPPPEFFQHQACYLTARILVEYSNGDSSIGSGFLCQLPIPQHSDRAAILLISNKHVFGDPAGNIKISFNAKLSNGDPDHGNIKTFYQSDFAALYYPHPDEDVDLACINVSAIENTSVYYKTLHSSFLSPIAPEAIPPGSDVIFIGYPENRFDQQNNLPIIRKGSIASLPGIDFNGKPHIIIDAQVFQGSSGSPVFVAVSGHYVLLGCVSATMIRHAQLQTLPASDGALAVQQILGLGIVIKQSKVIELIDLALNALSQSLDTA